MVLPTPSPFRYDPAADEASEAADSRDPNPYLTLTPTLTPLTLTLTLTLALALTLTQLGAVAWPPVSSTTPDEASRGTRWCT